VAFSRPQDNTDGGAGTVTGRKKRAKPLSTGNFADKAERDEQRIGAPLKRRRKEVKTRCDFMLTSDDGCKTFVEVKSVTLAETRAACHSCCITLTFFYF
jgi:hypothetical protein